MSAPFFLQVDGLATVNNPLIRRSLMEEIFEQLKRAITPEHDSAAKRTATAMDGLSDRMADAAADSYIKGISEDEGFEESDHPREEKGGKGGGRFRTSGKTIEKEDSIGDAPDFSSVMKDGKVIPYSELPSEMRKQIDKRTKELEKKSFVELGNMTSTGEGMKAILEKAKNGDFIDFYAIGMAYQNKLGRLPEPSFESP